MRSLCVIGVGLLGIFHALVAYSAGGDPEAGRRKTVTCNGCHGQASMQSVPKLGGQRFAYLVTAMQAYQEGKRIHATMRDVAKAYSDKEIKNFAAYYAQFEVAGGGDAGATDKPSVATACEVCHGAEGRAPVNPESAVLAGQKAPYLKVAIKEYRDGARTNDLMRGAVGSLSDADIDTIADYFAGLPGLIVK